MYFPISPLCPLYPLYCTIAHSHFYAPNALTPIFLCLHPPSFSLIWFRAKVIELASLQKSCKLLSCRSPPARFPRKLIATVSRQKACSYHRLFTDAYCHACKLLQFCTFLPPGWICTMLRSHRYANGQEICMQSYIKTSNR